MSIYYAISLCHYASSVCQFGMPIQYASMPLCQSGMSLEKAKTIIRNKNKNLSREELKEQLKVMSK
jgi:hypothetical protein